MTTVVPSVASCCAELYELPIVEYLLGQSFHPGGAKLTRQLASATLVSPGARVLDIACGNGNSARLVAQDYGAHVTGCDYSAANIDRAAAASAAAGLADKTNYVRCSAERLPFDTRSFDVCICECSLCLFDDMDVALQQIHQALKPGGRIGISDFFLNAPVPESLDNLLGKILCVSGAYSAEGYHDALQRAGFEFIRIRNVNWTLEDMIKRVRERLRRLSTDNIKARALIPAEWGDPGPALADLEKFIADGGAGYLIATARR